MVEAGVIVVGGGQGGFQVAASLREEGYPGRITLIGDEPGLPYQRPPLSKGFLAGKAHAQHLELRPPAFYAEQDIALRVPERVTSIDRAARRVDLASGGSLAYEHLVLATGARARIPTVHGTDLFGILPLRSRADAQAMLDLLPEVRRLVVVGGGFIGLEVAAMGTDMGLDVRVIEVADRVLKRCVSAEVSTHLAGAQAKRGVQFSFESSVIAFTGREGRVSHVQTSRGDRFHADLVVVGVGVEPNVELARDAGLPVRDGIVVDSHLRTADPAISAIGDCARYPAAWCAASVRLESVQNAVDQARCVAARLAGKAEPYAKVPWFWSDQGDHRLQIAGVSEAGDSAVLRGDRGSGKFSVFRFRAGRLSAVESINNAADHMAARKLLAAGASITPEQVADVSLKLTSLLAP
ncbi:MAG: FAD-dependent pyridine nucleotide-disulfide oxidoreductase [Ramlibacter sp.]|jgi:3-phenylpropionate/trans-cinnamate dioxygenase ferredoxin reductase subunit|nr:FAD-dependent pyridine nucleotide-disulfide oxidoreductase [Ramlibacter sp.]MDF2465564.1 FAD-dependent pyridine nucleotide-disulfide oxidoreductase [Ramlibacter sp.]